MENLLKYLESNEVLSIKEVIELKKEINIDFTDQPNKFRIKVLYKAICKRISPHLYGLQNKDSKIICQNIMEHYLFNKKNIYSKSIMEEILNLDLDYLELKHTVYHWIKDNNHYSVEPWKLDDFLKNYSINYYQKYKKYEEFEKIKESSLEFDRKIKEEKTKKRKEKEKEKEKKKIEVKNHIKDSLKSSALKVKGYKEKIVTDLSKLKDIGIKDDEYYQKDNSRITFDPTNIESFDQERKATVQVEATKLVDNFIIGELSPIEGTATALAEEELKEDSPSTITIEEPIVDQIAVLENSLSSHDSNTIDLLNTENKPLTDLVSPISLKEKCKSNTRRNGVITVKRSHKLDQTLTSLTIALYIGLLAIPKVQYVKPVEEAISFDLDIASYDTLNNDLAIIVKNVISHRNPEIPNDFRYKFINKTKLSEYLHSRNSMLAEEPYISIIINTAKQHDLNPNILFALAGQEQGFVPKDNKYAGKIINNPYNVFTSWKKYNTDLEDSTNIACRTIKNLVKERPLGENPFKWINRKYAQDKNWWKGINSLFVKLEGL